MTLLLSLRSSPLLPANGFFHRSASTDNDARVDIAASGFFGGRFERTFFDVRV